MLVLIAIENGVKKIIPLTADAGAGNPVGTIIVVCSNQIPSNYLPLGTQFDTTLYPVLYALLGTDTTPTASALGLPTLTSGQYAIKATSGLSENAQDNVINTLNEQRSYSTEEVNTGKKWIDGKPIYRKVLYDEGVNLAYNQDELYTGAFANINIDEIIGINGFIEFGYGGKIPLISKYSIFYFNSTNQLYYMQDYTQSGANSKVKVILEYTKTN